MNNLSKELTSLTFSRFIFHIKARTLLQLPSYKGSTFRGGFGHVLKKIVCLTRDHVCETCTIKERCIYTYIFETKNPESESHKVFSNIPHPFILNPPDTAKEIFSLGESFTFELVLFGRAIDYLPYFIYTFHQLGTNGIGKEKGQFAVESVKNEFSGRETEIYNGHSETLIDNFQIYSHENFSILYSDLLEKNPQELEIKLLTPLRIKIDGRLQNSFTFYDFFRSLINRLYFITIFHCGNTSERDHRAILEQSKHIETSCKHLRWRDWSRYSNRQKTKMKMGGLTGTFTIKGDLKPFIPHLKIGEYVHIGKATSMGLGRYEVSTNLQYKRTDGPGSLQGYTFD